MSRRTGSSQLDQASRRALTAVALLAVGCSGGVLDGGGDSGTGPGAGGSVNVGGSAATGGAGSAIEFAPGGRSFKRLTDSEFRNSLRDLLGDVTIGELEPDTWLDGFAKVGSSQVSISLNGVEKYQLAVESATAQVFADAMRRDSLVGCVPEGVADRVCFSGFVTRFGRLAWRRPLTTAQIERFSALARSIAETLGDAHEGLRQTTNALLLSPYFLYRLERGQPDAGSKWWRYSSHELASSIAYFLINSTPDSVLLDAADQDLLATPQGVREQAQRLLGSTRGRASVGNFATELFRLAIVGSRAKDPGLFPGYTPSLQAAMSREVPAMFESLVFDQRASGLQLFTTRSTFVNRDLALLYGLDAAGLSADSWSPVTLPTEGIRAGLLGTGAFLSLYANQKEGSPTQRGKFIRQFLLCQAIPEPPPDVSTVIEEPPPGLVLTKREKLAAHRVQPACAGCHQLMDPMGLTLENFDAIGAFRQTEHGLPIDATGDFDGTAFNGPIELGKLLSTSENAAGCMVRNLYRYATGHSESETEEPLIASLAGRFTASGHDMQELMLDLVTSDGFRHVAPSSP